MLTCEKQSTHTMQKHTVDFEVADPSLRDRHTAEKTGLLEKKVE